MRAISPKTQQNDPGTDARRVVLSKSPTGTVFQMLHSQPCPLARHLFDKRMRGGARAPRERFWHQNTTDIAVNIFGQQLRLVYTKSQEGTAPKSDRMLRRTC